MVGFSGRVSETVSSIEGREFLDHMSEYQLLKKGSAPGSLSHILKQPLVNYIR